MLAALSDFVGIGILVLGAILVFAAVVVLVARGRTREAGPDIPDAMKPGPSDAALETPLLTKLQGWSVILVAFLAVWMPLTFLREPSVNETQDIELRQLAADRGAETILYFSEENQFGVGCIRCHGPELRGMVIASGANPDGSVRFVTSANLTTVCGSVFTGHNQIFSVEDIRHTIEIGRATAGMPSWSIRFQGALDDQQIDDLVTHIVEINHDNVPFEQNVCENLDAEKAAITKGIEMGLTIPEADL